MPYQVKQASTAYPLVFLMVDSTDHVSGKTGLTPTVTLSKAGGAFASPAGAVTEIGSGWYKVAGNATDTGTLGPLILHATGTGADPTDVLYEVVALDVQDGVRAGLSALPNAAAAAAGGLHILGTNAVAVSYTAGLTISNSAGSALTLTSSGSNGHGLAATGNGSGNGFSLTGGATGNGARLSGGGTSGDGLSVLSQVGGHGLRATGGNANGGTPAGSGIWAGGGTASSTVGGAAAPGVDVVGGSGAAATNGAASGIMSTAGGTNTVASGAAGLYLVATSNGAGLHAVGSGTGSGITAGGANGLLASATGVGGNGAAFAGSTGGAGLTLTGSMTGAGLNVSSTGTGAGIVVTGGATSGDGITVSATSGHGVSVTAGGTSKHGLVVTGGTGGTSDGLKAVAGTGGVDVRGNITGTLTGSVTGSVGSVTGSVTVGTNADKTGYSLTQAFPANFASLGITAAGHLSRVTLVDTTTTNTDMLTAAGVWAAGTRTLTAGTNIVLAKGTGVTGFTDLSSADVAAAVWNAATAAYGTAGTYGALVETNLDAAVSSRMATYVQPTGFLAATFPGVVASPTNITAGTITTVTNLTNAPTSGDLTAAMRASVNAEVDAALADARLDELLAADADIDGAAPPAVGSVFHELMTKTAGAFTYDQATDSLEAVRDRGDAAWATATGFSTHTAADVWAHGTRTLTALDEDSTAVDLDAAVRAAVGLAAADLDAQLAAVAAAVDTEVAAVKAVTDKLDDTLEDNLGTYRFTAAALAQAPTGGGLTAADVWAHGTRTLTAGTNIVLAKGTGVTGFTDLAAADVAAAVWDAATAAYGVAGSYGALVETNLDAAVSSRSTFAGGAVASVTAPVTVGTNADKTGYSLTQAFPANFASLGITAAGHLSRVTLVDTTTTLTSLPAVPADWLSAAGVSAAAVDKIQAGLSTYAGEDTTGTTTLLARLTATRTGYLDNLAGGAVATAANLATVAGYLDTEIAAILEDTGTTLPGQIAALAFSTHTAADVWAVATRTLTAGTNIVLAKGTGVTGFNDLSAAQVNAEADAALADAGVTPAVTGRLDAAVSSRLAGAAYAAPLDAAGTRAAVGLAAADLDARLAAVPAAVWASDTRTLTAGAGDAPTAEEVAAAVWASDTRTLTAGAGLSADTVLMTVDQPSAGLVDTAGVPLTAVTFGQALTALAVALVGDRDGVGTRTITATLPGVTGPSVTARRASRSAIAATVTVPPAG